MCCSSHETRAAGGTGGPGRPARVLVIDDAEQIAALARLSLTKGGFDVETAATGHEGLALAAAWSPDLVVCDVLLPDMVGWDVVRRIREASAVPVLMLSGRDADTDEIRASGADDYLTKPFAFAELVARVRSLLGRADEQT